MSVPDVSAARSMAARIGGLTRHARHGSAALARSGSDALLARFEHEVDPEG